MTDKRVEGFMIRYRGLVSFTKHNALGEPFTVYREEPLMPRIDDRFLDCSLYLYKSEANARDGVRLGGSGFLAAVSPYGRLAATSEYHRVWQLDRPCPQPDFHHCYAVTNAHVARDSPVVRLNRIATSTTGSRVSVIPFTASDWTYFAPHDIAVAPIPYTEGNRYLFIGSNTFLTKGAATANDVGIGDETFMVGRFVNHEGVQKNNPSVRWGHVSMMPVEVIDNPAAPQPRELCFAVEMRSLPGYSGSAVFVRPFPSQTNTSVHDAQFMYIEALPEGPWLLGIQSLAIHEHFLDSNGIRHSTGMCGVIPAWHILDLLDTEKMRRQRKLEQEELVVRHEHKGTVET